MAVVLYRTNRESAAFAELCAALNTELSLALSGGVDPIAERANKTEDFADVVIAETEGIPVGCIALRPFSKNCAEIKRMYVVPGHRREGIGTMLLRECCAIAQEKGYLEAVLETNEKLPEAKRFYIKAGFVKMASYGPYGDLPETLCMKKEL